MKKQSKLLIGIIAAVAVLAVVIISIVMTAEGGSKDTYNRHLELAQRYLDELQYEQAIAEYRAAIEIDPKREDAYLGLAEVYVAMDDIEKALDVLAEGYEQTESERIAARQEELEEELARESAQEEGDVGEETLDGEGQASGTEGEQAGDVAGNESDVKDSRFEACMVDGIFHHGYEYYNLTLEEEEYLQAIIDQAQQENIDEVSSLLSDGDKMYALLQNHGTIWEADSDSWDGYQWRYHYEDGGDIHIAFHRFKIYIDAESDFTFWRLALIPLEDGDGYYFEWPFYGSIDTWVISACRNGMFDGEFEYYKRGFFGADDKNIIGTVKNGLLDGTILTYKYSSERWYRENYEMGKREIFEEKINSNGTTTYAYAYEVDENGEPIFTHNGSFQYIYSGSHSVTMTVCLDQGSYGEFEMDSGIIYYSW